MNKGNNILNRKFRNNSYTNVTLKLIVINVLVFLLTTYIAPRSAYYLAMIPSFVLNGYIWQFFTYMFVHGGFSHIFFNMLSLFIFGTMVEQRVGSKEYLLFYLLTGTASGIISFGFYLAAGTNVILVGASGAIYGVLLMFAVFYPYARVFVFGLIPIRAPLLVILYAIIELSSEVFGAGGNVAHLTHLSGLLFAYLYCRFRMKINPIDVWKRTL
jgi:membrane associated rhomboid family serine protease